MDLEERRRRARERARAFMRDVRLVWANCRAYNRPMSTISRMADVLSREWETALRDRLALSSREAARLILVDTWSDACS